MPRFAANPLQSFVQALFERVGVPRAEAEVVAGSLVDANLCGHDSHGVMRAPQYIQFVQKGIYKPGAEFTVINETAAILAADGGWGFGQVQAHRLLERLAPKAEALGLAAGSLRHCGHTGRLGEYAEWAAARSLALFATVNSHGHGQRVAPPGGREGRLSTNPICFGLPTSTEPVVLDFGTSVAAEGKVRLHFQNQQPTPPGWLQDQHGQPTTNPAVLYTDPRGALLPFGGEQSYKGFGLSLVLDLLAGGLSGGATSNPKYPLAGTGNCVVFVLFRPESFAGLPHFLHEAEQLTTSVRSCPPIDPNQPVRLPGDPERATKADRLKQGIPIPEATWQLLVQSAEQLQVPLPAEEKTSV